MRKISAILLVVLSLVAVVGCRKTKPEESDLLQVKSVRQENAKKIIFLMVDSLMAQAIDEGIRQQRLPAFQYLIGHGQYYKDLVSSFPTMSVAIDSTLLTGKYPDEHGVPGLIWYSSDARRIVNYGTGPMEVLRQGIHPVLTDALIHLNGNDLNRDTPTLYEELARRGLKSGSINGLIYRGETSHTLTVPGWIRGLASLDKEIQVKGPDFLALGSLTNPLEERENLPDGLTRRMGMNNEFSVETVKSLIQADKLPDFLFAYLPDMDQELHQKGPSELSGVEKVDRQLQAILEAFGSPEKALEKAIILVAGDSGMTQIHPADRNPEVDLPSLLEGYSILRPGESPTDETEIALAVNETMAYVYGLKGNHSLPDIADRLKRDSRVDFVAWKDKGWVRVVQGGTSKTFKYKAKGNLTDRYKQTWTAAEDESVLDLKINAADRTLAYGEYPDGLRRLQGALNSHRGDYLVVTAKPGYELADRSSPTHKGGGGHGSIRRKESLVPLLIVGTERKPPSLRMVDLKAYMLGLLADDMRKSG
ncbi:alkaline phosphatase family protein [Paenibacillaceae bacterium WGS1546]|uniref:alkaline phosphatase family protein n=1 Tax=Cohnella sp. WGS1546 TaxID=3366810 RepID=UPI00372D86B7